MKVSHASKISGKSFSVGQVPSDEGCILIDQETKVSLQGELYSNLLYTKVNPDSCTHLRDMFLHISHTKKGGMINKLSEGIGSPTVQEWLDLLNKLVEPLKNLNLPAFNDMHYFRDIPKPYHFDTIPGEGSYTAILTLKNNSEGGRLVLPEYGISFPQNDCDLIIFNGAKIIHGVTPISNSHPDSYRISLVAYHTKHEQKKNTQRPQG